MGSACIFAEMMNGKILFPGESDMGQLLMILEIFGKDGKRTGTPSNIREKVSQNSQPGTVLLHTHLLKPSRTWALCGKKQTPFPTPCATSSRT